jgi:hypothetical protein
MADGYQNSNTSGNGYGSPGSSDLNPSAAATKICFAPSELFGQIPAQGFGYFAEAFIIHKLKPQFHASGISPIDLFTDYGFAGPIDKLMIGYMMLKNPLKAAFINTTFTATPHKRPDIIVHTPFLQEFYEVKPDSISGRYAGKKKVAEIDAYMLNYGLPYTHGVTFVPPSSMDVGHFFFPVPGNGRIRVDISIGLRISAGCIYYTICIETNWDLVLALALTGAFIVAVFKFFKQIFASITEIIKGIGDWVYEHPWETAFIVFAAFVVILAFLEPTPIGEVVATLILAAEAEVYMLATASLGLTPILQAAR